MPDPMSLTRTPRSALLVAALLLLSPALGRARAGARAPDAYAPAERVERGRLCYEALDYACAERELAAARAGLQRMAPQLQAEALRLSSEVALAGGKDREALIHLDALLALSPDFAPPAGAWPPHWRKMLEVVRADRPDRRPPKLGVVLPKEAREGAPLEVRARVEDRSGVSRVVLHLRAETPAPPISLVMTTADGRLWSARIPASRVRGPHLSLWIEAWDRAGNGPARWKSAADPGRVPLRPEPVATAEPLTGKWWFWTLVGVGATAAGVTTWLLLRGDDAAASTAPAGSFNDVKVLLKWPSP